MDNHSVVGRLDVRIGGYMYARLSEWQSKNMVGKNAANCVHLVFCNRSEVASTEHSSHHA